MCPARSDRARTDGGGGERGRSVYVIPPRRGDAAPLNLLPEDRRQLERAVTGTLWLGFLCESCPAPSGPRSVPFYINNLPLKIDISVRAFRRLPERSLFGPISNNDVTIKNASPRSEFESELIGLQLLRRSDLQSRAERGWGVGGAHSQQKGFALGSQRHTPPTGLTRSTITERPPPPPLSTPPSSQNNVEFQTGLPPGSERSIKAAAIHQREQVVVVVGGLGGGGCVLVSGRSGVLNERPANVRWRAGRIPLENNPITAGHRAPACLSPRS